MGNALLLARRRRGRRPVVSACAAGYQQAHGHGGTVSSCILAPRWKTVTPPPGSRPAASGTAIIVSPKALRRNSDQKDRILEEIVGAVRGSGPFRNRARLGTFIRHYYADVDVEDLRAAAPENLAGAALAHLELGMTRRRGRHRLRIYNPDPERDGWDSTHTIVEMVNDNMPFLVDSLGMAVARTGANVHLTVHPLVRVERDAQGVLTGVHPRSAREGRVESFVPGDRPGDERPAHDGPEASAGGNPARRPRGRAGLAPHAREDAAGRRRARGPGRPGGPDPGGGEPPAARVDGGRTLHLPRLPGIRGRAQQRRGPAAPRGGHGPRHPVETPLDRAPGDHDAGDAARGPRAGAADTDQGERTLHGAPTQPPRLHRREGLRRGRRPGGRETLPRAVHLGGLQRESARHPAAAAESPARS